MPQHAISTGAIRSANRRVGSCGQRLRWTTMATGTARISPPNDESPPCQMATIWAGLARVVREVGEHLHGPGADDGGHDDPHEQRG